MRRRRWAALTALLLALPAGSDAATSPKEQLSDARRRAEEVTRQLTDVSSEREHREEALASTERRVAELEDALNDALRVLDDQQRAVARVTTDVDAAQTRQANIEDVLNERARRAYMHQIPAEFRMFASGADIGDVLQSAATLTVLTRRDGATLEQLEVAETTAAAARERLLAEQARLVTVKEERQRLLDDVLRALDEQRRSVAAARAREGLLRAQREDLEAESAELRSIIAQARSRTVAPATTAPATTAPARTASPAGGAGYVWPSCGRVTSEFGPRWGRAHEGIDIDGVTGDVLRSSNAGTVIFAGWSGGYGRLTLIQHADGVVTAYAHQSRQDVSRGQQVGRGQPIGLMGSTGNVTGDHLHFETRVGGRAVNPRRYLPRGC